MSHVLPCATALKEKKFLDIWKLANVVPVRRKEEEIC